MSTPANPKIYHITHVDNLTAIARSGELVCDAEIARRGGPSQVIGMSEIKRRRIEELPVTCHPTTKVGDYVPFYFCPRSIMLYVIYCANNPELAYCGGQGPIIHLQADLGAVVQWAKVNQVQWAFSLSNAGARYTEFRSSLVELSDLNWDAIEARDFREAHIKEGKQAEFLLYGSFPLELIERIGVRSPAIATTAEQVLQGLNTSPLVEVLPQWYY
jgi:hypothetical protein